MSEPGRQNTECVGIEQLAVFADGGFAPEERGQIEAHVAGCGDCFEALAEITAIRHHLEPPPMPMPVVPPEPRPQVRRAAIWIGGPLAAAAAAAIFILFNVWSDSRPDELESIVITLAQAPRDSRLGVGRLSVDRTWAPAPLVLRSGTASRISLDVLSVAQGLKVHAATDQSPRGLHAYGLALMVSGEFNRAIDALERAVGRGDPGDADFRSDLAATLLERQIMNGQPEDAARALAEADRALLHAPRHLSATFNRALALDALARPEARQAWQAYIDLDRDKAGPWIAEAIRRRDNR